MGGTYKKSTGQSYKLPPFFIFKLETSGAKVQPVIERKAEALGAYATTTDSGWMKDEKFLWYVIEIWDNWLYGKRFGTRDELLEVHVQEGRTLKKNEVAIGDYGIVGVFGPFTESLFNEFIIPIFSM